MADTADFLDLHPVIIRRLEAATGVRTSSKIPEDLTAPAVVVFDVTGLDDHVTESAQFDVQVFAPTRSSAWAIAAQCRTAMHALPTSEETQVVDSVDTVSRPIRLSYGNPDVVRYVSSYRVTARVQ